MPAVNFILNETVPHSIAPGVTSGVFSEDAINPNIFHLTVTNNSGSAIVVGVGVYQDQQSMTPVVLSTEVFLKEVDSASIPNGTTTTIDVTVDSPNCIQLDAFLKSGKDTNGNSFTAVATSFFTPGDSLTAGPEIDAGYNVFGVSGGTYTGHTYHGTVAAQPSDIKGTLIAVAQTDGSCLTPNITSGDTATIGFWQNKNGQAIINGSQLTSDGHTLGQWLTSSFPHLFSSSVASSFGVSYSALTSSNPTTSDAAVASLYVNIFKNGGSPKVLAQIFDTALSSFTTSKTLNNDAANQALAMKYGFNVSVAGTGIKDVDIGASGAAALGLTGHGMGSNGTTFSILTLLQAADAAYPNLTSAINDVFDSINSKNDIKG